MCFNTGFAAAISGNSARKRLARTSIGFGVRHLCRAEEARASNLPNGRLSRSMTALTWVYRFDFGFGQPLLPDFFNASGLLFLRYRPPAWRHRRESAPPKPVHARSPGPYHSIGTRRAAHRSAGPEWTGPSRRIFHTADRWRHRETDIRNRSNRPG